MTCPNCQEELELYRGQYYCYECDDIIEDPTEEDEWEDTALSFNYK